MNRVGIVALQGNFEKHAEAIRACAHEGVEIQFVRTPQHLDGVDRLIIPGGESTTVGILMQRFGLGEAIQKVVREGMPVWGTCMGMIMLATDIEGNDQYRLRLLDITVRRNAFGAQVHSFEAPVKVDVLTEPVMGVFIRAPIVSRVGDKVKSIATFDGKCVAVQEGKMVGTSFHPELTDDTSFHRWFLNL